MSTFQIAFDNVTKVATVQGSGATLPVGSVNIGLFDHVSDPDDELGGVADKDDNHVIYHHVQKALYARSAADPSQMAMFPDNITDMASITIVLPEPVNTVAPAVTGTAQVGQVLTAANGTWTGSGTYTRNWQTSEDADGPWIDIAGATNANYSPVVGDVGNYLRAYVVATNVNGTGEKASNVVGPVLA